MSAEGGVVPCLTFKGGEGGKFTIFLRRCRDERLVGFGLDDPKIVSAQQLPMVVPAIPPFAHTACRIEAGEHAITKTYINPSFTATLVNSVLSFRLLQSCLTVWTPLEPVSTWHSEFGGNSCIPNSRNSCARESDATQFAPSPAAGILPDHERTAEMGSSGDRKYRAAILR